jgi:uncharacterized protein YaaR (DUF327 family)
MTQTRKPMYLFHKMMIMKSLNRKLVKFTHKMMRQQIVKLLAKMQQVEDVETPD